MDYTTSDAFATDAGTGNRLHQDEAAVTTEVSAQDMNGAIWELMSIIRAKGLAPIPFDKTVPGSYTQVLQAIQLMIAEATQDYKASVRVATTAAINLAAPGAAIDDVAMVAGDLFLDKDNATPALRGIYVWNGAAVAATRATDADGAGEMTSGMLVVVEEGTNLADSMWMLVTDGPITIGTTALTFARKDPSSAGGAVRGAFSNLNASATGTNASVSVSADQISVEDASNSYATLRNVNLTINAAGSGANGLDAGVLAASTWYSLWVIWNGSTAAGLLSLSSSAPTLPSNYTHKARVGWIRTDSSGNKYPLGFTQKGRRVQYVVAAGSNVTLMPQMASGIAGNPSTTTWAAVATGAFVPPTASRIALVIFSNSLAILAPNTSYGGSGGIGNPPPWQWSPGSTTSMGTQAEFSLESSNVYWATANSISSLSCMGWEDNL